MLLQLTEIETKRPIYFQSEQFIYAKIIGSENASSFKERTHVQTTNGTFECEETPERIVGLMKALVIADTPVWASDGEILNLATWMRNKPFRYRLAIITEMREV